MRILIRGMRLALLSLVFLSLQAHNSCAEQVNSTVWEDVPYSMLIMLMPGHGFGLDEGMMRVPNKTSQAIIMFLHLEHDKIIEKCKSVEEAGRVANECKKEEWDKFLYSHKVLDTVDEKVFKFLVSPDISGVKEIELKQSRSESKSICTVGYKFVQNDVTLKDLMVRYRPLVGSVAADSSFNRTLTYVFEGNNQISNHPFEKLDGIRYTHLKDLKSFTGIRFIMNKDEKLDSLEILFVEEKVKQPSNKQTPPVSNTKKSKAQLDEQRATKQAADEKAKERQQALDQALKEARAKSELSPSSSSSAVNQELNKLRQQQK